MMIMKRLLFLDLYAAYVWLVILRITNLRSMQL